MVTTVVHDQIDYLVERRFPGARAAVRAARKGAVPVPQLATLNAALAYRKELGTLTPDELAKQCREEQEKEKAELRAQSERDENERFFNMPHTNARLRPLVKGSALEF